MSTARKENHVDYKANWAMLENVRKDLKSGSFLTLPFVGFSNLAFEAAGKINQRLDPNKAASLWMAFLKEKSLESIG